MGVQPPSDDIDDGPDVVEFGIAALEARLEDRESLSYPVALSTVREKYGDITVPINANGTEVRLGDALEEVETERFESERDLLNELHPVFERRREGASRGLVAQLRALVPF